MQVDVGSTPAITINNVMNPDGSLYEDSPPLDYNAFALSFDNGSIAVIDAGATVTYINPGWYQVILTANDTILGLNTVILNSAPLAGRAVDIHVGPLAAAESILTGCTAIGGALDGITFFLDADFYLGMPSFSGGGYSLFSVGAQWSIAATRGGTPIAYSAFNFRIIGEGIWVLVADASQFSMRSQSMVTPLVPAVGVASAITSVGIQKATGATGDVSTTKAPGEAGGLLFIGTNNGGVAIVAPTNTAALTLTGDGVGQGLDVQGGANADGIRARSGASQGFGICSAGYHGGGRFWGNGDQAPGLSIYATSGDAHGIQVAGSGAGSGIYSTGYHGLFAIGTGNGSGVEINGGTNGNGIAINSGGSSGSGIVVTSAAGHGLEILAAGRGAHIQGGESGVYISGTNTGIIVFGNFGIELCASNGAAFYAWSQNNDAVQLYPGPTQAGVHVYGGYNNGPAVMLSSVSTGPLALGVDSLGYGQCGAVTDTSNFVLALAWGELPAVDQWIQVTHGQATTQTKVTAINAGVFTVDPAVAGVAEADYWEMPSSSPQAQVAEGGGGGGDNITINGQTIEVCSSNRRCP